MLCLFMCQDVGEGRVGKDDKNVQKRRNSNIMFIIGGINKRLILIYEKGEFSAFRNRELC